MGKEEAFLFILCPFCLRNNLEPRVFVPYCACWLDETSCFPTAGQGERRRWVRGCLRNRSDGVKAINYLALFDRRNIFASLTKWGAHLLVKWGKLENARSLN